MSQVNTSPCPCQCQGSRLRITKPYQITIFKSLTKDNEASFTMRETGDVINLTALLCSIYALQYTVIYYTVYVRNMCSNRPRNTILYIYIYYIIYICLFIALLHIKMENMCIWIWIWSMMHMLRVIHVDRIGKRPASWFGKLLSFWARTSASSWSGHSVIHCKYGN